MTLGEHIVQLRKKQGLSQEDLAAALAVSRQSVSKWETDASVPELEKLLKLSELFDITLDELVWGESPASQPEPTPPPSVTQSAFPPRKIAGTVLLCMAFLVVVLCTVMGGLMEGLILCTSFLVCGIVCFASKRHAGLWCAWSVWSMTDLYLRMATGIRRGDILLTPIYEPSWNYTRLAIAWVEVVWLVVMVVITVRKLGREPLEPSRKHLAPFALLGGVWLLLELALRLGLINKALMHIMSLVLIHRITVCAVEDLRLGLLTALLVLTLRFLRYHLSKRKNTL